MLAPLSTKVRDHLSGLKSCRLCRQVTFAVFIAILIVEAIMLIVSVFRYEEQRLLEYEREGLTVARSVVQGYGEAQGTPLEVLGPVVRNHSVLIGATIYTAGGGVKIGQFGETPSMMYMGDMEKLVTMRQVSDDKQYMDVLWQANRFDGKYIVAGRIDVSDVGRQVSNFIWRILGLITILSICVTFATMLVLERYMLMPIRSLRTKMQAATNDPTHPDHHIVKTYRDDELGDVAAAFNNLLRRLSAAFDEIQIQQQDMKRHNETLGQLVSERTRKLNETVNSLRREALKREKAEKIVDASNSGLGTEDIKAIAYTDTLTGLPNRDLFRDRCLQVMNQTQQNRTLAALVMVDIDGFNRLNELHGHDVGDALLQACALRLQQISDEGDTVSRIGSDVFALIQTGLGEAQEAAVLADIITYAMKDPIEFDGEVYHMDVSVGVAMIPTDGDTVDELMRSAELGVRRAKEDETTSFHFFTSDMHEVARKRVNLEKELRDALAAGDQFEVHYQPKQSLKDDCIVGMEALVRWRHPERGLVSPAEFIPIAESSRLIVDIGEWVLREAARQNKIWHDKGLGPLKVAVNLSAVQLKNPKIVDTVRIILLETGLSAACLELEITESAVMDDVATTIETLNNLRALGVSLSIDDFGTGYSSLAYLKEFPVSRVKIDKAFVDEIQGMESDATIAKAVIMMGHSFGMEVTAEGVESHRQIDFLRAFGCDEIQGYCLSKPLPADNFMELMRDHNPAIMAAE